MCTIKRKQELMIMRLRATSPGKRRELSPCFWTQFSDLEQFEKQECQTNKQNPAVGKRDFIQQEYCSNGRGNIALERQEFTNIKSIDIPKFRQERAFLL